MSWDVDLSSQRSATLNIAGDGAMDDDRLDFQVATDVRVLAQCENSTLGNNLSFQFSIKAQLRFEFDRSLDLDIAGKNILRSHGNHHQA